MSIRFRLAVAFYLIFCSFLPANAVIHKKETTSSHHKKKKVAKRKLTPAEKRRRALIALRTRKMKKTFVASTSLKPMARQLLENRSGAAYRGVEDYARRHASSDTGTLANLVLGYAHILDRDYAAALVPLKKAQARPGELGDYADYFTAMAHGASGDEQAVIADLKGFNEKYPDSVFTRDAAVIYANALVAAGTPAEAIKVLEPYATPVRSDVELALGRAYVRGGEPEKGIAMLRRLYYNKPTADEADTAGAELVAAGAPVGTKEERRARAEALAQGKRYQDAIREYRQLQAEATTDEERASLEVAIAISQFRSGDRQGARGELESLVAPDEKINAERLSVLCDLARSDNDQDRFLKNLGDLRTSAPTAAVFEQQLLSAGNMFLLKQDYDHAIDFYRELYERFPTGRLAHYAHWKATWLSLRQGRMDEARKGFEDQIALFPESAEVPAALYWRGRIAEDDHDVPRARAYYAKISERFRNYYYADRARERMVLIGEHGERAEDPILDRVPSVRVAQADYEDPPEDDIRLQKSRLLENAGLTDFAIRELQAAAADDGKDWAATEIAKIYQDNGGYARALEYMKRTVPTYWSMDVNALPRPYWEVLFPRPYWNELKRYAAKNHLDPYLVASLIRQESEFNPGAVSRTNALGLMQIEPGTGRMLARELRIRRFNSNQLLVPTTNLQLGTRFFRHLLDQFGGRMEYALAAYNAGTDRVQAWLADGKYRDEQEFVESIPFTETREYVQAIMRNATVYKKLYQAQ